MSFANLVRNIRSNKHSSLTTKSLRNILVSFCVISPCLFMTSDCLLTRLVFLLLFIQFGSFVTITHLFIACLTKTIDLSSLPPSQSSVDHKEFKRCGPFDPYINAKVCTQCCQNFSFKPASLLYCCVGFLCLGVFVAVACGVTLLQRYGEAFNFAAISQSLLSCFLHML